MKFGDWVKKPHLPKGSKIIKCKRIIMECEEGTMEFNNPMVTRVQLGNTYIYTFSDNKVHDDFKKEVVQSARDSRNPPSI